MGKVKVKGKVTISAKLIKADGTIKDLGIIYKGGKNGKS